MKRVLFLLLFSLSATLPDTLIGTLPNPRVWVPLNIGFNANEILFIFAEYSLPVSDRSWDIMAIGSSVVIR